MKRLLLALLIFASIGSMLAAIDFQAAAEENYPGFRVKGRFLYDKYGVKVILVGVNKMVIWTDIDGLPSYEEIAKTGANCVRIVWTSDGTAKQLDTAIYNCRANSMIPMVEHHGATGAWNDLQKCVDYWTRPDVVAVIKKHQEYLLINIANECGDANVSTSAFRTEYTAAVQQMRQAGIHVPLIIDGTDWGKNINILQSEGPALLEADPDHNLLFSVHMWWPQMWGYSEQTVIDEIAESVNLNLPLIVGEFGALWEESAQGQIPYKTIMEQCHKNQIGWLAWSWGPGNNPQTFLDMTEDSTFATLHGWGLEVAVTDQYSIKNTAVRPAWLQEPLPPLPTPTPLPVGNLAVGKPVWVSSVESNSYPGSNAVDGDLATRWSSGSSDPQYLTVDLGRVYAINRVILCWENAYGRQYKLQVSDDGNNWTDLYTEYNGDGETDDLAVTGSGRYVRIYGLQRYNTEWGYSLWEIGVYSPENIEPSPTGTIDPTPTLTPTVEPPSPSPTVTSGTGCTVTYTMNDWGSGATVTITISNKGTTTVNNWELKFNFPGDQKITNLWCAQYTQSGTAVTVTNEAWNSTIPPGGTVSFGFNLSYSGTNAKPAVFTLNGTACSVE
ncbi:MAG TPA: cellulose binding domain-containing protein [Bacillota bacterium]